MPARNTLMASPCKKSEQPKFMQTSELNLLFEVRAAEIRAKDVAGLMSLYAPEIVYFDLVPPLRYVGAAALRERFTDWFKRWQGEIGQETRELTITVDGNLAGAFMLLRTSGTLNDGGEVGYWVRVTNICRCVEDKWLITHEHVSLPTDMKSGRAVLDAGP
jgi:ketosteroid isomerase-like protein